MTTDTRREQDRTAMRSHDRTIPLEAWQWAAVRRGVGAVVLGVAGEREIPPWLAPPQWLLGLERFTIMLELHWQVELPARLPDPAVARAAQRWPRAWDLAGLIRPRIVTPPEVARVVEHLDDLGAYLSGERTLPGVADLAGAIAAILRRSQAGGSADGCCD